MCKVPFQSCKIQYEFFVAEGGSMSLAFMMKLLKVKNLKGITVLNTYICRLMDTAKEMIKESLPIKCLEAVILGVYPFKLVI